LQITGTHINYYFVCHRKLWLFANGINMEHTSDLVSEGRLIHETTYTHRTGKYTEVELGSVRIDYYDPSAKIIHETKKSGSHEEAHEWQLKYYIFLMKQSGIEGVTGILEYPKLRETQKISLTQEDEEKLDQILQETEKIIHAGRCPEKIKKSRCRNCSYFDFCYASESNES